jgi:iron complex outermembrane recepter protein
MRTHAILLNASLLALHASGIAAAQTSTTPNTQTLEEVIVTAERRATRLDRTPIAATVLSGEQLANNGVTAVDQLQFVTPATTVNNFGQGTNFNIRGIGKAETNSQTTTGVITYRDGVPSNPGWFTAEPYYDIRSIEVLRGPQGTFVGANATGGAVFITTNDPIVGGPLQGYLQGQVGNYDSFGAQGAVNIPISDTLAARVALYGDSRDSFFSITGPYRGDDGVRIGSGRLSLLWQPSENLTVSWKTDLNYLDLSAYPGSPATATTDLFNVTSNARLTALDRFGRTSLRIDYEFANGLMLRSVSSYSDGNTAVSSDPDGTSIGNQTFSDSVDDAIWSQELNLISADDGLFSWILGAYYQDEDLHFPTGKFVIGNPAPTFVLQGHNYRENSAVFGQASFNLPARLQLQLGARYSQSSTVNDGSTNLIGAYYQREEFSNLSGKVTLNWTANDDHFLYAFAATGFRPGGLNVPVVAGAYLDPFDEEEVRSYEVGWKAGFFDGHLRTQVDAFYTEYDNFQVTVRYPLIPVFNIELNNPNTTTMHGFEAQAQAVFGGFSLDAGLALLSSDLGRFFATDRRILGTAPCDPQNGPASATCIDLTGHEQTYAPELTYNISAQYDFELGNGDRLTPRIGFGHVSEQWATLFANPALGDRLEARDVWNAQLAWQHGSLTATLYGTNVADQHYVAALNTGLRMAGFPRQYGLRLMKTF